MSTYLTGHLVKKSSEKVSGFMSETLNLLLPERTPGAPKAQANWMSAGPGGGQVTCLLEALAKLKKNGVTGDHVVFSFLSRRLQPLQHQTHPAFRYEGTKDPSRMSPEPMAESVLVKR